MKKGILFLAVLAMTGLAFVLLVKVGNEANAWETYLIPVLLLASGYLFGRTNFNTDDNA